MKKIDHSNCDRNDIIATQDSHAITDPHHYCVPKEKAGTLLGGYWPEDTMNLVKCNAMLRRADAMVALKYGKRVEELRHYLYATVGEIRRLEKLLNERKDENYNENNHY